MSAPLSPAGFAEIVPVSRETLARLETYMALLQAWSSRINLVGRASLADPWRRHILDSAQLFALIPTTARSLADLGSGAGLPGLILAILGAPGVELIEADARKCAFLREAVRVTGAAAAIRQSRIENLAAHPFDVVTARALAPLDRLLDLAAPLLGPGSLCLFLKGERAAEELTLARKGWTISASLEPSHSDPRGVVLRVQQAVREPR